MAKDWTGNKSATFATLGASNHSAYNRSLHDYYATEPVAVDMLAQTNFFDGVRKVWEPACGGGHLSKRMVSLGMDVVSTDLYNQGFGECGIDFLESANIFGADAIVTNPPYKYALEFCEHSASLGVSKFAMFLKLTFLEGAKRQKFFQENPPKYVAVCVNRVQCALNGDKEMFSKSSAACYAWFIWERNYNGSPTILWVTKEKNG